MLNVGALIEFYELASQNNGTLNAHLKHITEGLLGRFFLINALSNQKCATRRGMRKPQIISFERLSAWLIETNKYLLLIPGLIEDNKISSEELNKILLYAVPNEWLKQSYQQGWNFEWKTHKETCKMF